MGHWANIHTGRHQSLLLVRHSVIKTHRPQCSSHSSVPHERIYSVNIVSAGLAVWRLAPSLWTQRERREPSCVCVSKQLIVLILLLLAAANQHPHTGIITTGTPASARRSVSSQSLHSVSQLLLWLDGANPPTITPHPSAPSCRAKFNLISPRSTLHQHFHHASIRWSGMLFWVRVQRVRRLPEALTLVTASVLNRDNNLLLSLSL